MSLVDEHVYSRCVLCGCHSDVTCIDHNLVYSPPYTCQAVCICEWMSFFFPQMPFHKLTEKSIVKLYCCYNLLHAGDVWNLRVDLPKWVMPIFIGHNLSYIPCGLVCNTFFHLVEFRRMAVINVGCCPSVLCIWTLSSMVSVYASGIAVLRWQFCCCQDRVHIHTCVVVHGMIFINGK